MFFAFVRVPRPPIVLQTKSDQAAQGDNSSVRASIVNMAYLSGEGIHGLVSGLFAQREMLQWYAQDAYDDVPNTSARGAET
jgi:hypothetical protein